MRKSGARLGVLRMVVAMETTQIYAADASIQLLHGDALAVLRGLPSGSVRCIVTSPPYWGLRDYGRVGKPGRVGGEPGRVRGGAGSDPARGAACAC